MATIWQQPHIRESDGTVVQSRRLRFSLTYFLAMVFAVAGIACHCQPLNHWRL
ncbi:MAG: hypothetical protein ACI3YC_00820 [Alloprevotella sp.]